MGLEALYYELIDRGFGFEADMRWFVEVSRVGESGLSEKYCVDAKQWQAALQEVRRLRGDSGALSKFSLELLDVGYRAVDPGLKLRYLINPAPADAPLTEAARVNPSLVPSVVPNPVQADPAPSPSRAASAAPRAPEHSFPAPGALPVLPHLPVEIAPEQPYLLVAAPSFQVLRERAEEPRPDSPITYREVAYAVPPGTPRAQVEALLWARYKEVALSIADRAPGKFVHLAVFDHVFQKRPERPPLATFAWKDWRGSPSLAFPGFGEPAAGPMSQVPPARPSQPGFSSVSPPEPASVESVAASPVARSASPKLEIVPDPAPPFAEPASPKLEIVPDPAPPLAQPASPKLEIVPDPAPLLAEPASPKLEIVPDPAPLAGSTAPIAEPDSLEVEIVTDRAPPVATPAPPIAEPDSLEVEIVTDRAPPVATPAAAPERAGSPGEVPTPSLAALASSVVMSSPSVAALASSDVPAPSAALPERSAPEFEIRFEANALAASAERPSTPAAVRQSRPRVVVPGRRPVGEDLIGELFEIMHDLHFMRDVAAGAEFVLSVLNEVLPCEGVLIHVFDINTNHFVTVRAKGPNAVGVLLQRMSGQDPLVLAVMRSVQSVIVRDAANDPRFNGPRWKEVGVAPKMAVCGAVRQGGRYLGLIELVNPEGGTPFHPSELNALDYICEQFALFLSNRPIIVAADVVLARN